MQIETRRRKVRLITGSAAEVEELLHTLDEDYAATTINFAVVHDELVVTAILIDKRELRMVQMMQPAPVPMRRN